MKKFFYTLRENPNYPEVMIANSKEEVRNLLLDNIGSDNEDQIISIFSEDEMRLKNDPNIGGIYKDAGEYSNGNDFLNDVIKSANNILVNSEPNEPVRNYNIPDEIIQNEKELDPTIDQKNIKYFEEGGIQFKVECGRVYKKVWKKIENNENFRIINSSTNKPINSEKYFIEKLDWIEI